MIILASTARVNGGENAPKIDGLAIVRTIRLPGTGRP